MPLATPATVIPLRPLDSTAAPALAPAGQSLPVPAVSQRSENWCWAACMQMVINFFGNPADQCDIVNRHFGQTTCCQAPNDPACNQSLSPSDVVSAYNSWGRSAQATMYTGFDLLQREIGAGRPVQVGFVGNQGGAHAAVARGVGMGPQGPVVIVNDPFYGSGSVYYQNLLVAYGYGTWRYTWWGIA